MLIALSNKESNVTIKNGIEPLKAKYGRQHNSNSADYKKVAAAKWHDM